MARKIQFRRGPKDNLPTLSAGEPALTLDTNELYLGTGEGNMKVGTDGKRTCRFVVGTSAAGWTAADVDYLCDGTDDDVEIRAAINALPSNGGEIVILDGTYHMANIIYCNKRNLTITGNGASTILQKSGSSSTNILQLTADNIAIKHIILDGNSETHTLNGGKGIGIGGENNICISNVKVVNCNGSGVDIYSGSSHTIENSYFENNYEGIYVGADNCNIINNKSVNNSQGGIRNTYSDGMNLINNIIDGNSSSGIMITSSNNVKLLNNTITNNTQDGIYISSSNNVLISENYICDNNGNGIEGLVLIQAGIFNNYVYNNDNGINIFSNSNMNSIAGNSCLRGTGAPEDYTSSQYTIRIAGNNNAILSNFIMGKNYIASGTGNTFANNKYN